MERDLQSEDWAVRHSFPRQLFKTDTIWAQSEKKSGLLAATSGSSLQKQPQRIFNKKGQVTTSTTTTRDSFQEQFLVRGEKG